MFRIGLYMLKILHSQKKKIMLIQNNTRKHLTPYNTTSSHLHRYDMTDGSATDNITAVM